MEKVLYSNYYEDLMSEEEAREILEENGCEDINESDIYEFINDQSNEDWYEFIKSFERYLQEKYYVATGTCGLWYGKVDGGKLILGINTFMTLLQDCDYIKIIDNDGRLLITCSHHDGTNHYELRELNDRGVDYYFKNDYRLDRKEMCERLFKQQYSKRPRLFKKIYGC